MALNTLYITFRDPPGGSVKSVCGSQLPLHECSLALCVHRCGDKYECSGAECISETIFP